VNVLLRCTACGHHLTEPLRRLPEPSGAPFVPHPDPEWTGAGIPGLCMSVTPV
jgi:hypothetical protein